MKFLHLTIILVFIASCKDKPVVLQVESKPEIPILSSTPSEAETNTKSDINAHQIIAKEVRHSDRYTYILAVEGKEEFWIAVPKQEIEVNRNYLYRDALLKTNFYSKEFDKTLDKIYLVGSIISADKHPGSEQSSEKEIESNPKISKANPSAISLKVLFESPGNYSGKTVVVNGKCVKANYGIMGRNWYHIQDNSKLAGKILDLTITSNDQIQLGDIINFEGIITLNKDFGSGYKYDLLMEQAVVK
ncbi:MAG: hypothetical protein HOP11_12460 [Saprospiraceae bacterium]|nr:hypothetical protein [Saprospiraceae bacterium]